MRPEVLRTLIIAQPILVHEVQQLALARVLERRGDLGAAVRTRVVARLVVGGLAGASAGVQPIRID